MISTRFHWQHLHKYFFFFSSIHNTMRMLSTPIHKPQVSVVESPFSHICIYLTSRSVILAVSEVLRFPEHKTMTYIEHGAPGFHNGAILREKKRWKIGKEILEMCVVEWRKPTLRMGLECASSTITLEFSAVSRSRDYLFHRRTASLEYSLAA